jgi:hypothetical protein
MAFSVKQVKAKLQEYGVPAEYLETATEYFCSAHKTDLDAIKEERDTAKEIADKMPAVQKELEDAKAELEANSKNTWKVKYEALKEDFEDYKNQQTAKETKANKEAAYKVLLENAGVAPKRIAAILKVTDLDSVELDESGNVKDADKHTKAIKEEWADFIQTISTKGATTANPPSTSGKGTKTKEEIWAIKDPSERQRAIAENHTLFGI